ncbi:MAG: zinc-dependent metalloprotease [Labilithrix sp.]|nr:zinc-dependent metalloprotease [Labilithrix sp.]MCW5818045.1 zinc-dependent metalloprotease [Labilithrix sp.]
MTGCAEERDPISRVQANAVAKSFFLGPNLEDYKDDPEFRTKSFNIDSGANTDSHVGAIGGASAVERVRWEVTENFLFARRAYQESPGADNRGLPRKEVSPGKWEFPGPATGTIVAAYRIQSHFDIRRSYNPATGEEQNVIEENVSDRPWFKRQYMRVDWGTNVAQSTSGDTSWVFGGNSDVTPIEYAPTNDNDEDRPHFEIQNGYFDVTNKYQLKSSPVGAYGIPECVLVGFFNGTTTFDCSPVEVKMRSSFIRLTGDEDFEPFEENKTFRDVVGNWGNAGNNFNREYGGAPITAWDPQYGYTDANTHTFYSFHNIWEKSHLATQCGSNADEDGDGTADECQPEVAGYSGSLGSQCDVYIGRCTIPVRDRKIKPIGYWLNADAPEDLQDEVSPDGKTITSPGALEEMTITWSQLVKVAVAYRREVECRRTHDFGDGDHRDDCHDLYFEGTGPESKEMVRFGGWGIDTPKPQEVDKGADGKDLPAVTTCHNPVRAYDLPMCGKPGELIRLGDLRKNYAIYWPHASRAPYGGVASIGGDPLTGEMIGVTATTMMRSAYAAAAQQRDIISLAMGDVKIEDLIQGVQASTYVQRVKDGKIVGGLAQAKSAAEISAVTKNIDLKTIQATVRKSIPAVTTPGTVEHLKAQIETALLRSQDSLAGTNLAKANLELEALMKRLDATPYKTELGNRNLYRLVAESQDKSSHVYNSIKTIADQDSTRAQDIFDAYQAFLGARGVCFADGPTNAGAGSLYQPALAPYFKAKYSGLDPVERGKAVYKELLRESVKGIAFHEIGHSIGLRHNFASSWDSLNYAPQYWQLRTKEGTSTTPCTEPRNGGDDTCLGPRYLDPLSDDEQGIAGESRPGIEYFANTSTMEYQIERFGETVGAGTYDLHAMKTLYGRVLETFDSRVTKYDEQQLFAVKMLSQGIAKDLILDPTKGYGLHYTRAAMKAKVFDPARDCRPATEEEKEGAKWRIVHGKVCSQGPRNHLAYEDMKSDPIAFKLQGQVIPIGANGVHWKGLDYNKQPVVRWQYRYGEDYSRGGYIHAKLFDSGADIYEITMNVIRRFDETYPWGYFRRQNREWAWWGLSSGVANNTYARLRAYHWSTTTELGRVTNPADLEDDDGERPALIASQEMFNFLQRALLMPEPGSYGGGATTNQRTKPGGTPIFDVQTETESKEVTSVIGNLGLVDGRYVQVDFDNSLGGSWDYQRYPAHAGFDDEKALAIRELVDSRPTLSTISRENALDGRDPYISFRTDTPQAIDRLLGGILSEDWETVAPSMSANGTGIVTLNLQPREPGSVGRPAGNKGIVFPNLGYSNQLAAGIYAMLFSRFSTDLVLMNKMRIQFEGDLNQNIPVDRRVSFVDPVSGYRYLAARFGNETINGKSVDSGIASRMLLRANELASRAYDGTTGANGEFTAALSGGQPTIADEAAEKELRRYVGLLDAMRQIANIFGNGPLGGGGGGE